MSGTMGRGAVFLDRDGVLNIDTGYPHRPEALVLTPSAAAGVARINAAGLLAIVVTNQSGVARGLFTLADVDRFHDALSTRIAALSGGRIDHFYVAPFHKDGIVPAFAKEHPDRKPGPGMLLRAIRRFGIDPARSVMIGDKASDMEAARRAGVAGLRVPSDICDLDAAVADWLAGRPPLPSPHSSTTGPA